MTQPILCTICGKTIEWCNQSDHDFTPGVTATQPWVRYIFKIPSVKDFSPIHFDPRYPWWQVKVNMQLTMLPVKYILLMAYLPTDCSLTEYWADAFDVQMQFCESVEFSPRFPKPEYFIES